MPLPPIPTQAADQVNISRQPKPELKKRPKRVEIEETSLVDEAAPETLASPETQTTPQFLAQSAIERMKAPAKGSKKAIMATRQSPKVRKIPDDGITRMFVLDTNVLMHDPTALFRFEEHDVYLPMMTLEELDNHKKGMSEVARNARTVSRSLDNR
jgi:PhoH-like ATPase